MQRESNELSKWDVSKVNGGWLVTEWLPGDAVPTARSGICRTKAEATAHMRKKKAASNA